MPAKNNSNPSSEHKGANRREFLKTAGLAAAALPLAGWSGIKPQGVTLVTDAYDTIAASAPVKWAISELTNALKAHKIDPKQLHSLDKVSANHLAIVISGAAAPAAVRLLKQAKASIAAKPEALGLIPLISNGKNIILAAGHDERGLVYALLELTDRLNHANDPYAALQLPRSITEQPANRVRSLNRLFVSDIEDKGWFNDREMWPKYLTMLATQRYNMFNLSLGIGYDNLQGVTDAYFLFAYPFLLQVPGYDVQATGLPDAERDSNLKMLQFISEQTVARGIQFRLGLWMHGYEWIRSPNPNYTNRGLNKDNHAAYCRDALRLLLKSCPAISGITLRVHGESGVSEGSYDFWKTIFEGAASVGRTVAIDLHPKGIDDQMLNNALATGMPVSVSPKYWAEHMGMPYHQADIRQAEIPKPNKKTSGMLNLSEGVRSFTRYGYSDLLKEGRNYDVVHRIWPGTQRLLLWGDPLTSAAQSKAFSFCDSAGVELMEPLSFKGRRGSGIAGDRCGYADVSLRTRWDWEKYLYSLRVFGRTLYNPDTDPDVYQRFLRSRFNAAAMPVGQALAAATRILPIVTTAYDCSAGNNNYWPELYTNLSIIDSNTKNPYYDTPVPKIAGTVSPLDPQLFLGANDMVKELLSGERSGKYTLIEVAAWLTEHANTAEQGLKRAGLLTLNKNKPEYRRMAIDVAMQAGLGRFFAAKFRAAALYAIYDQTGDRPALEAALKQYRQARGDWAKVSELSKDVYMKDVTAGDSTWLRGHWLDRLPDIDADVEKMAAKLEQSKPMMGARPAPVVKAISYCLSSPARPEVIVRHRPPQHYTPGSAVPLSLQFAKAPQSVTLYYRHVTQAERFQSLQMAAAGGNFQAAIPAAYTLSDYPLEYYFEVRHSADNATIYPGLGTQRIRQPYFVVRKGVAVIVEKVG